jgi:hypothetical protein
MKTKPSLLCSAALGVVFATTAGFAHAAPAAKHHRHHAAAAAPSDGGLKAEVESLRQQVEALENQLAAQNASQQQTAAAAQTAQAQAQAAASQTEALQAKVDDQIKTIPTQVNTAVAAAKPKNDKIYYKGVTVTMGGFAAAEGVYRDHNQTADIGSSYAKIPYANDRAGHTGELHGTARQSRYSILVQGNPTANIQAGFYGEFDFLGAAQTANSNESNSYQPRIRNLYGQLDDTTDGWHFLAGQSWSLATLNGGGITPRSEVIPATIEAQYVPGFVWTRQPQIRLAKDFNKQFWIAVSAENPQTTLGTTSTATGVTATFNQAPTSQYFNGTNYSLNDLPDFIGKAALEENLDGHQLHAEVFGIYRSYLSRVTVAPTATNQAGLLGLAAGTSNVRASGGGVGGGVTFGLVPKILDLQLSGLTGKGIGRYGSAQLPDVTARADGTLEGIPESMWLAGATLHATKALDLYVYGGQEFANSKTFSYAALGPTVGFGYGTLPGSNNAGCFIEGGSCSAVTRSVSQVTAGFWDKIYQGSFGRVQVGLQYSYTEKKAFQDASGIAPKATENMVFTSFRYYPF